MKDKYGPYLRWGLTVFITFVCCILFFFIVLRFQVAVSLLKKILGILSPILWGLLITYLLWPLIKRIQVFTEKATAKWIKGETKRKSFSLSVGLALSLMLMLWLIIFLLNMVIPELKNTINTLISNYDSYLNTVIGWIDALLENNPEIHDLLNSYVGTMGEQLQNWLKNDLLKSLSTVASNLTTGVIGLGKGILNFVIGIITAIYITFGMDTFKGQGKKILYAYFTPDQVSVGLDILHETDRIVGGFISGKIIDSLIIGVIAFFSLTLLKMPYAILVSVIVGVTNVIPFFGPFIGAVPSAFLILLVSPKQCLIFILFILVLQQIDGNIIGPKILGESTGLSSFWIIFAILLFGGLFGFTGMLLGVPIFGVFYYLTKRIVTARLQQRKLPTGTDAYSPEGAVIDPVTRKLVVRKQKDQDPKK